MGNRALKGIEADDVRIDDPIARKRMARFLGVCGLLLVNLALVYMQLAFFPIFSDNADVTFHCLLYFMPFVGAALVLDAPVYAMCSAILGITLCIHANWMPIDYYEQTFASPVVAMLFSVVLGMYFWLAIRGLDQLRAARGWKSGSLLKRELPFVVGLLVVSSLLSLIVSHAWRLLDIDLGTQGDGSLVSVVLGNVSIARMCLQALFDWAIFSISVVLTDVIVGRFRRGDYSRALSAVFRRWLLVVVTGAFLVLTTIGYCLETMQALSVSEQLLSNHITYLIEQIEEHVARQTTLRNSEDNLVLGKARSAARLVADDPALVASQEEIEQLRDTLELSSLTVCDGEGTVVADSDGQGIGTFNFGSEEQTKRYMSLLNGVTTSIIEEPRNSIGVDGETEEVRVFAGASLPDGTGFVQVSIEAAEYQKALVTASLDNLVSDYTLGTHGTVFISDDNEIISANDPSVESTLSGEFDLDSYSEEERKAILSEVFSGRMLSMRDTESAGMVYLMARRTGDFGVFAVLPASEVFASRTSSIVLSSVLYLVLFGAVFSLASALLDNVVVRGFRRTNGALALITGGNLDCTIDEHETEEFDSLSEGINTTVGALRGWIAEAETRMERELTTAKAIQEGALPSTFPPFPEIDAFDIYASMSAAKEVGGDFYDFFLIDDHTLGFLIADVSGKGIPGALFMMAAKSEIGNYMSTGMPLAEAIQTANHHLCIGNDAGMFVTVWAATLDYATGELTYVNAGHNFPLLRHGRSGEWEWLKKKCGLFLGTFETAKYRSATLTLQEGDELLLYTDGVNEAFSVDEVEYGNDRLEKYLAAHTGLHPRALVEGLRSDVAAWAEGTEQSDDITMVCIEYGVAPEVSASITVQASLDQLGRVMSFVHTELGKRLCPIGAQNKLDIALEELFVNVCNYAYAGQDEPGTATISYVYTPRPASMTIQIEDTGVPFDPLTRSDPSMPTRAADVPIGGLGIMMTKRSVDDISYMRDGNRNVIAFTKRW